LGHKDIIQYVQDRIHLAPIFRYKYVEVPFGLDKPYWIEDPDFDIEFHIRHIALPHPGDWRQLCILVSRLNSRPIDFSRPLWEAYVIEGLDNIEGLPQGSFAIMVKTHHSIVDGASGQGVFGALHDLTPDGQASVPAKPMTVDRKPTSLELIGRAIPNRMRNPLTQVSSIYKTAPNLIRNAIRLYKGELQSGTKLKVPPTRFNKSLSPHRVFEGTYFDLEKVKSVKNSIGQGTTVNDVMMNIVAGGMRKYLSHHSELPAESLAAMMPVDIRTEETRHIEGNQVGGIFSELHTEIDDHIERLLAIHDSTNQAKALSTQVNTHAVIQNYMFGFMNPKMGRRANRLMQSSGLMEKFGPFACNTLITNVPGPNFPLYHAGAEMVAYWGIPPLTDCMGLGHAVFSYCGRISLSAIADRTMMEDPGFYIECLNASFDEMYDASQNYEANVVKAAAKNKAKTKRISSAKASSSASAKADSGTVATATAKDSVTAPSKPERKRAVRKKSASSTPAVSAAPTKAEVKAKTEPKAKTDSKVKAKAKAKAKPAKKAAAKPSAKTANKAAVKEDAKVVEKTAGKGAEKAATTASNKVEGSATPTT
jgi:WS/DGAT/MGAT family acyltransferase